MHVHEQTHVVIFSQSDRKRPVSFKVTVITLSFVFVLFSLALPVQVLAATIFSGVGNDGYFNDVRGLFSAMQSSPSLTGMSDRFLHKDQTGNEIATSIRSLGSVLEPGDTLIWYYSGHGSYATDADHDELAAGAFAKDGYDETIGLLNGSESLSDDALGRALLSLSSKSVRIITIFDTCYSGGFIGGNDDLNMVPGITFLASSGEQEDSYAYDNEPYSIFTTGLINGLQSFSADADGNGQLSAREWFDYAYDFTVGSVASQHPVFHGDDVVIASARPVPLPGAVWLLGGALFPAGLFSIFRKFSANRRHCTGPQPD